MTELEAGVDGFLIYDTNLVPDIMNMINKYMLCDNQLAVIPGSGAAVKALDLLGIPLVSVSIFPTFISKIKHDDIIAQPNIQ